MVHPPGGRRRVRLADGGRAPDLHAPLRPEVPGGLLRRGEQATLWGGPHARTAPSRRTGPRRLRVRTERGLLSVRDVRAVARLASCHGDRTAHTEGLRSLYPRHGGPAFPSGDEGPPGAGQP